jgi:hypothetical protein
MTEHVGRHLSVDDRHVELAEPRGIANDLDLGDLAVRDREPERSHQSSLRRHHDADGPIGEAFRRRQPCARPERSSGAASSSTLIERCSIEERR